MFSSVLKKMSNVKLTTGKSNLLYNSYVLYLIVFASIVNTVSYGLTGDMTTPLIFILVALMTSSFSKNMIMILAMGLAVSNIVKFGANIRVNEGLSISEVESEVDEEAKAEKKGKKTAPVVDKEVKPASGKSTMDPGFVKDAKEKLKSLKTLQSDLMTSITTMDTHMKTVEKLMETM
jgi:hypothetical protein